MPGRKDGNLLPIMELGVFSLGPSRLDMVVLGSHSQESMPIFFNTRVEMRVNTSLCPTSIYVCHFGGFTIDLLS